MARTSSANRISPGSAVMPRVIRPGPPDAAEATKAPQSKATKPAQKRTRGGRGQRKNCMDAMVRRRALEADPWTVAVESTIVLCKGCKRWIKLDQRNDYYSGLWVKHRGLCKGIKIMNGEALPRRVRKKSVRKPKDNKSNVQVPPPPPAPASPGIAEVVEAPVHQASPSPPYNVPRASSVLSTASNINQRGSSSPVSERSVSQYPGYYAPVPGAIPVYGMFPGYGYGSRAAGSPVPQGYPWPGYSPYGFYVAYYPAPVSPPMQGQAQAKPSPPPSPAPVVEQRASSPFTDVEGATDIQADVETESEDDDDDVEVFAPSSVHASSPVMNSSQTNGQQFRFSTRREIKTYSNGAITGSLVGIYSAPTLDHDNGLYRGNGKCLMRVGKD